MNKLQISEIQIIPIKPQNGLVAFCSVVINFQFYVGNLGLYSSPSSPSGFRVTFPTKKLASGKVVDCFHPITQEAGRIVSEAIIKEYVKLMDNFQHIR